MSSHSRTRRGERGATMVLIMLALPLVMIPLVGLAIDGTRLYIVQAKLSAAVDGAALGAGRLIGTNADTTEIAGEFLDVNFPSGFWGTYGLQKSVNYTNNLGTRTINVSASVNSPLLFMRILGQPSSLVAASAVATRRDSRVVLVLDQSGSMGTVINNMKAGATAFTGMFTPGVDELGFVAFSGSAIVGYPSYTPPYDTNPLSTTQQGPNKSFGTSSTAGPMFDQIAAISSNGGTSAAEALALAYIELQKAHFRDVATNGSDTSTNSIVFFTDGMPTSVAVSPNDPSNNALKSSSPCTWNPANRTVDAAHKMRGYVTILGSAPPWNSSGSPNGLSLLRAYDTTSGHTSTWWLGNALGDYGPLPTPTWSVPLSPGISGCTALGNGSNWALTDLAKIPPTDYYGTSTGGAAYTLGRAYASTCAVTYNPNQSTSVTDVCQWGLAMWNATDNIGKTIRGLNALGSIPAPVGMLPVTIYTIGYNGNGGVDPVLLKRLANTADSTSVDASQPIGKYIQVESATNLAAAFTEVAGSLLRLKR
jgi:Flp pilus assembly protein TadG